MPFVGVQVYIYEEFGMKYRKVLHRPTYRARIRTQVGRLPKRQLNGLIVERNGKLRLPTFALVLIYHTYIQQIFIRYSRHMAPQHNSMITH